MECYLGNPPTSEQRRIEIDGFSSAFCAWKRGNFRHVVSFFHQTHFTPTGDLADILQHKIRIICMWLRSCLLLRSAVAYVCRFKCREMIGNESLSLSLFLSCQTSTCEKNFLLQREKKSFEMSTMHQN